MGEARVLEVFQDVLADTDRRWREFNANHVRGDVRLGQTDMEVSGVSIQETVSVLGGAVDERNALAVMPEHYIVIGDIASGQRGMETFGMFGEPTYVHGEAGPDVPAEMPFQRDPSFPLAMFGEFLLRDNTDIHVGAFHQFRPTAGGFQLRSIFFVPKAAPMAVADGHKLHFAIEISNCAKVAHQIKNGG